MDQHRIEPLARSLTSVPSRRDVLRGFAAVGLGFGAARHTESAVAGKGKPKPKSKKSLCAKDGSECRRPGKKCKKQYCLSAPFTIATTWTQTANHDSYLFVPSNATTGQFSYINQFCKPETSVCAENYPFACFEGDEDASGEEVATIHRVLPGTYEYWVELVRETPAGAVTVVLEDKSDRVVRRWTNPANATKRRGWHVFDIDDRGRVTTIDDLDEDEPVSMPSGPHGPADNVCPD